MDMLEQRDQVLGRVGRLRDGIDGRVHHLDVLALGDVVGHGQAHLPLLDPARCPADVRDAAILAHIAVLEVQLQLPLHDRPGLVRGDAPVFGVHQVQHAQAHGFLGAVAKDALERRAHEKDAAIRIHDTNRVEQQIDNVQGRNALHGQGSHWGQCVQKSTLRPLCSGTKAYVTSCLLRATLLIAEID